jgi:hypothetical protein
MFATDKRWNGGIDAGARASVRTWIRLCAKPRIESTRSHVER